MNKTEVNAQEDCAFDAMDLALDKAQWKRGQVVVKANNAIYFCYDIYKLHTSLTEIAVEAVRKKYKQCNINVKPVVDNVIEEYAEELTRSQIVEQITSKKSCVSV